MDSEMATTRIQRNERDWAGQLIGWLQRDIENGKSVFEYASNDTSVLVASSVARYPDVLLFLNKTSGIVFNGWELKFPDTPVDDETMLLNALEKAKRLHSSSFVTWNCREAIIWGITDSSYSLASLVHIKDYPAELSIKNRIDVADPVKFNKVEAKLRHRALEILSDLGHLYTSGKLKPAINISGDIISAINASSTIIVPEFAKEIKTKRTTDPSFKREFAKWKIYESSTLQALNNSSRNITQVSPDEVLARFTFYNVIGKILFYLTLQENLSGRLNTIKITDSAHLQSELWAYFSQARAIDYAAVFTPYFTDDLVYSKTVCDALYELIKVCTEIDFRILPNAVIGNILENLIPKQEKLQFGQYFTPEILANLVAFPAVQLQSDVVMDPTSGTGTFLVSFYNILHYLGLKDHSKTLDHIWGNDISHFPAILSVINLYKQDVSKVNNFPKVLRHDFFSLSVGQVESFPDSKGEHHHDVQIPLFDGIASNFPFIQQEDIPQDDLIQFLKDTFGNSQQAFLQNGQFKVNKRADYFTYCVYQSFRFLKNDGILSVITSNAWLGKEYGVTFKRFLLDNFQIKMIVRSTAEHWFSQSEVKTIYFVLKKGNSEDNDITHFVTIDSKLADRFGAPDIKARLESIESFYEQIEYYDAPGNKEWTKDKTYSDRFIYKTGDVEMCNVKKSTLRDSVDENWETFFESAQFFMGFENKLVNISPSIADVVRGTRTGWNPMFIIKKGDINKTGIDTRYLVPYLKNAKKIDGVIYNNVFDHYLFSCTDDYSILPAGTKKWIDKFRGQKNVNGSKTIEEACSDHKPYWYSLKEEQADIITSLNPFERIFFTSFPNPIQIDQRLIALKVKNPEERSIVAALLNSIVSLLSIEMRGTSRYLGVLDLDANYLKAIKILNPNLLQNDAKKRILKAFEPLTKRSVLPIEDEVLSKDRIKFDTVVFKEFGIDTSRLASLYKVFVKMSNERMRYIKSMRS